MTNNQVTIKVKLFAVYQEAFDTSELTLNLAENSTVNDVLNSLIAQKPQLEKWRDITRFGINLKFVEADTLLQNGDEVVLIPPVSGG